MRWWGWVTEWWRTAHQLSLCDCQGVPNSMYFMAAEGMTLSILCSRMMGVPWSERVIQSAARHGHLRTVMWLQLFGCPWRISDISDVDDTSSLRWLLQYEQPESCSLWLAAYAGSLPSLLVFLSYPFDPLDMVSRWFVSGWSGEHESWSDHRHIACVILMTRHGFLPLQNQEKHWRKAVRKIRLLDAIPQAAALFAQRRRAAVTVQRWWLYEYYTPGRPVWLRRMDHQFRCMPQLPGSC